MKILLLGKNGQVGWELQRSLAPLGELTSLDRHSLGLCGDLSDLAGFAATVQDVRPDVIVNGQTKLEGEQLIATTCAQHLIFRTSWVYAARGGNFAKTMLRLARERNSLRVIDDQFGTPTGAELLADVTAHAIRQVLQRPGDAGLYHVAAAGEATWCSYANHVLEYASLAVAATDNEADYFKAAHADPIQTSAYPTPAQRPLNSRLNTGKLQATFGLVLPPWQAGVNRMLDETL